MLAAFSSLPQTYPALKSNVKVGDCGIALVLISRWCWQGFGLLQLKKLLLVGWVQLPLCRLSDQLFSSGWNAFIWVVCGSAQVEQRGLAGAPGCPACASAHQEPNRSDGMACGSLTLPWRKKIHFLLVTREVWSALGCNAGKPINFRADTCSLQNKHLWNWNLSRKGVYGALSIV